jgi:hypothetical protein
MLWRRASVAISSRSTSRGCVPMRQSSQPSGCRRRWRGLTSSSPSSSRTKARPQRGLPRLSPRERAPKPRSLSSNLASNFPGQGTRRATRCPRSIVNTRSQAEMLFHELWRYNHEDLAIALHHGSLDVAQRRKVEAAMVAGKLRAVACRLTVSRWSSARLRSKRQRRGHKTRRHHGQVHSTYSPSTRSALPASVPSILIGSIARWSAPRPIRS